MRLELASIFAFSKHHSMSKVKNNQPKTTHKKNDIIKDKQMVEP